MIKVFVSGVMVAGTLKQKLMQLNMFEDTTKQLKGKALQEAILSIRSRYGKNSILKGMNYEEAATGRERNLQIGGHKGGRVPEMPVAGPGRHRFR